MKAENLPRGRYLRVDAINISYMAEAERSLADKVAACGRPWSGNL